MKQSDSKTRYIPLADWNKHHDWPAIGGLRYYAFNCHKNGFDKVIKKVGRRVLIDEDAFFIWLENQSKTQEIVDNKNKKEEKQWIL